VRGSSGVVSVTAEAAAARVLPDSGGGPLSTTCPATPLKGRGTPPRLASKERELEEVRLLMITKAGIGGFGDNVTKDEAREDAAVFETEGISKTEHDISEPRKKQRRREGGNRGGKQIWTSNAFGNNQPSDNVSNLRI
jgi:hypothetical protein